MKKYEYDSIIIFGTAKDTDLLPSKLGVYAFSDKNQAWEWEISIFVNANKQYQPYLGKRSAITDASAEVLINPLQPTSANSKTHILEKEELIITPFVLQSTVQFLDQAVIPILRR